MVVPTYGGPEWRLLANTRAIPSAEALGVPVLTHHGATLQEARNTLLDQVTTEWVCHLDADDELEPGYFQVMAAQAADIRAPAVRYVRNTGVLRTPAMPRVAGHSHRCDATCLTAGNWLVVGSLVRADLARKVGGWRDFTWSEDWDLWLRCHLAGATIQPAPAAVYRAHVRPDSRNRGPLRAEKVAAHNAICRANGLETV